MQEQVNSDSENEFYVLRRGEQTPMGPYSQQRLVELLNSETIHASDYVYYPELSGWKRMSQVFDMQQEIPNLGSEGQDPLIVSESYNFVEKRTEDGEDIYYVAVQHMPAITLTAAVRLTSPKAVVITNHRICVISQKLLGDMDMAEYPLHQIQRVVPRIKSGQQDGVFEIQFTSGDSVEIDKIPFAQLNRMDEITPLLLQELRS